MASILFTIGVAVGNALDFSGTDLDTEERKRHDLALEKLQRARRKRLDLTNKRLCERNKARAYIKNVDEAMLEYYRVFAKQI